MSSPSSPLLPVFQYSIACSFSPCFPAGYEGGKKRIKEKMQVVIGKTKAEYGNDSLSSNTLYILTKKDV